MRKSLVIKLVIAVLVLGLVGMGYFFIENKKESEIVPGGALPVKPVEPKKEKEISEELREKINKQIEIKKFESYDEFDDYVEERQSEDHFDYPDHTFGASDIALSAKAGYESNYALRNTIDYSETNVQVKGVDEADIIKTDGRYIYTLTDNNVYIVDASKAEESKIISQIKLKAEGVEMYINGNNIIIFGGDSNYVYLDVYDIEDKKNPKDLRTIKLKGHYSNSRMIGDYVYFVSNNKMFDTFVSESVSAVPELIDNEKIIPNKCIDDNKCFTPDVYYFNSPQPIYNFSVVSSINIKDVDQDINSEIYLLPGEQNMYVSENNIYITYTKKMNYSDLVFSAMKETFLEKLPEDDVEKIERISSAPIKELDEERKVEQLNTIVQRYAMSLGEARSKFEKDNKREMKGIYKAISKELEKTVIHKIAINKGKLEYKNSGEVTGRVLNQFSMDENDGYFRIATTKDREWMGYIDNIENKEIKPYNNVYVLDESLDIVGSIEELAKDEKIYSARFEGNKAYVVTFKEKDPLYIIDLEDPREPKVLGELKVPGFSTYLHPYNDNFLIGLGHETESNKWGWTESEGLKLSLFDVSDYSNPKEVDTYIFGGSGSTSFAMDNHKAFLFSEKKNLLVIPVSLEYYGYEEGYEDEEDFDGAVVFNVTEEGFKLKGKINHFDGNPSTKRSFNEYCYSCPDDEQIQRALYIDDRLYTFSDKYLKSNSLDDLDELYNLRLRLILENELSIEEKQSIKNRQETAKSLFKKQNYEDPWDKGYSQCPNFDYNNDDKITDSDKVAIEGSEYWVDMCTGLYWEARTSAGLENDRVYSDFFEASDTCHRKDMRLPTVRELSTLYDYVQTGEQRMRFPEKLALQPDLYEKATSMYHAEPSGWSAKKNSGIMSYWDAEYSFRCVKDYMVETDLDKYLMDLGEVCPSLVKQGNGYLDECTNLTWSQKDVEKEITWPGDESLCEEGFRRPNLGELLSIKTYENDFYYDDYEIDNLDAHNTKLIGISDGYYWTTTQYKEDDLSLFVVNFKDINCGNGINCTMSQNVMEKNNLRCVK